MNRYSKVCAKNAMLLIDNVVGNENIVNTGVVCDNKKAVVTKAKFKTITELISFY